jgi:Apea-like HEPN
LEAQKRERIVFEGSDRTTVNEKWVPNLGQVMLFLTFYYFNTDECREIQSYLESDRLIEGQVNKMNGTESQSIRLTTERLLQVFLTSYLKETDNRDSLEESAFEKCVTSFEVALTVTQIRVRYWSILEGLKASEPLDHVFHGGLRLRSLTTKQIENLWNNDSSFRSLYPIWAPGRPHVFDISIVLEAEVFERKIVGEALEKLPENQPSRNLLEPFWTIEKALRLISGKPIRLTPVFHEYELPWLFSGSQSRSFGFAPGYDSSRVYAIGSEDMSKIQQVVKELKSTSTDKPLSLGTRKLSESCVRSSDEDAILDIFIALEAMAFKKGEQGEFTYKLSQRVACLLGKTPAARKSYFKKVKNAYNIRSKIIHGELIKNGLDKATIEEISEIARNACLLLLSKSANKEKVEWDEMIFN